MTGRIQAFTTEEFIVRLRKVQSEMRNRGVDLILLHSPENIYYLTGYQTSGYFAYQVLCVPTEGMPVLLVRYLERGNIPEYSWLENYETWKEGDNVVVRTVNVIDQLGAAQSKIGLETERLVPDICGLRRPSRIAAPRTLG